MTHAAESAHWYTDTGQVAYEVPNGSKGGMRPTTLRDARKLGLVPSVTGIIRCADRPALTTWLVEQGIMAALTLPRAVDEPEKAWLARVRNDAKEQARKASERGTAIHAAIQGHYEGTPPSEEFWPHVQGATKAVCEWAADQTWYAEASFAHVLGYGGKVDLHSDAFVLDFKTKEFDETGMEGLKAWDEHAMQLAAYREGLAIPNGARCGICYVSVNNPGLARVIEIPEAALSRGWDMFLGLLSYWKALKKFDPAFERIKRAA